MSTKQVTRGYYPFEITKSKRKKMHISVTIDVTTHLNLEIRGFDHSIPASPSGDKDTQRVRITRRGYFGQLLHGFTNVWRDIDGQLRIFINPDLAERV